MDLEGQQKTLLSGQRTTKSSSNVVTLDIIALQSSLLAD
jgi:hypothetical protein